MVVSWHGAFVMLAYAGLGNVQTPSTSPTAAPTTLTLQPTRVRACEEVGEEEEEEETGRHDMNGSEVAVVLLTLIALPAPCLCTMPPDGGMQSPSISPTNAPSRQPTYMPTATPSQATGVRQTG